MDEMLSRAQFEGEGGMVTEDDEVGDDFFKSTQQQVGFYSEGFWARSRWMHHGLGIELDSEEGVQVLPKGRINLAASKEAGRYTTRFYWPW